MLITGDAVVILVVTMLDNDDFWGDSDHANC